MAMTTAKVGLGNVMYVLKLQLQHRQTLFVVCSVTTSSSSVLLERL
jgi:hypothetical protein